ncbi:MAG: hypothetical protein ABJA89_18695 [Lapillicoccus sp.]
MPLLTAHPDDLTAAGLVTGGDATTLDTVARLVTSAGLTARAAGGHSAGLLAALDFYSRTESTTAAALGEAAALLGRALADAGSAYAVAEESVTAAWAGWPGT